MSQETSNLPGLSIGHVVAIRTATVDEAPWLGRCTGVGDDTLEVVWMDGGWNKQWKELKIRKGRKLVEWKDTISKDTVILYAIELTKSSRLKAVTVEYLKEEYSKLCAQIAQYANTAFGRHVYLYVGQHTHLYTVYRHLVINGH